MEQLKLTSEQNELLERMDALFKEARDKDISFVYDVSDGSLTAFNSANVSFACAATAKDDEGDKEIDFELCCIIENAGIDSFMSRWNDYYLKFT